MSRTYKDRPGRKWKCVKNKLLQSTLMIWGCDFKSRRKDRSLSRLARKRLNRLESRRK